MNKSEIVAVIADELEVTRKQAENAVDTVFKMITDALAEDDKVVISGFGTFEVRERVAREGRNPRTGEIVKIEAQRTPAFKAGKVLKDAVNK